MAMMKLDKRFSPKHFHVTIFGSARIKKHDKVYKDIYRLAEMIGKSNWDIITGGGPGIMEAANLGHEKGNIGGNAHSIGLGVELPHEQRFNRGVQLFRKFKIFSRRLDNFMLLSNAVVIAPGGVGTMLELFYTWQLMQVGHTCQIPIIILGDVWKGLIKWLKDGPLEKGYFEKKDLDLLYHAKDWKEAIEIIDKANELWKKGEKLDCHNYKKYRIK
ncbi:MAG: LOG family protein [Nanoarchaeota archaeon]|nr:LOG family protein [Nanoarchaeota archaeon]